MAKQQGELFVDLIDWLLILAKQKKIIIFGSFLIACITAVMMLLTHPVYRAVATIMPPERTNPDIQTMGSMAQSMTASKKLAAGLFSPASDLENIYIGVLKSATLELDVIDHFDLLHEYGFINKKSKKPNKYCIEDVISAFEKHLICSVTDEGFFTIAVDDTSPVRAATMANYICTKLDEIYIQISTATAKNKRIFIEEQRDTIIRNLSNAESTITTFQQKTHIVDIDQQAKATIDASAALESKCLSTEIELNIANRIYTADNPKAKELAMQLSEMKKQRDALMHTPKSDILLPLNTAPELGMEFIRLRRNLEVQEKLYELIVQQYEMAKLEEASTKPHIQFLDRAMPPQKKIKPQRTKTVLIRFVLSFAGISVLVLLFNAYKNAVQKGLIDENKLLALWRALIAIRRK